MTREEAIKRLKAKLKCMEQEESGLNLYCNSGYCDNCDLCYLQGNWREQKEYLKLSIEALKQPEIIYCKDCKYYSNNTEYCQCDNTVKSQKHYCSYGERRCN